jgi:hypothetical protein
MPDREPAFGSADGLWGAASARPLAISVRPRTPLPSVRRSSTICGRCQTQLRTRSCHVECEYGSGASWIWLAVADFVLTCDVATRRRSARDDPNLLHLTAPRDCRVGFLLMLQMQPPTRLRFAGSTRMRQRFRSDNLPQSSAAGQAVPRAFASRSLVAAAPPRPSADRLPRRH